MYDENQSTNSTHVKASVLGVHVNNEESVRGLNDFCDYLGYLASEIRMYSPKKAKASIKKPLIQENGKRKRGCFARAVCISSSLSLLFSRLEPVFRSFSFQIISSLVVVSCFPALVLVRSILTRSQSSKCRAFSACPLGIMYDAHADLAFELGPPFLFRGVFFRLSPLFYLIFQRLEADVL